jgi:hypothetical protein
VAIVISEETGQISVASDGRLRRNLSQERLRLFLLSLFRLEEEEGSSRERPSEGPVGSGGLPGG